MVHSGDCSNAESFIEHKNKSVFLSVMAKDFLPKNRSRSHIQGGMELLLAHLDEEQKNPAFYSFEIRHQPEAERPYPVDHELLSLRLVYHDSGQYYSREDFWEIVRPQASPYWYLCQDYKRKGKSLNKTLK